MNGETNGVELSPSAYLWIQALHVISVMSWMAGLLYLPRLFAYHTQALTGSDKSETFKIMERRLFNAIMTPAMLASILFGGLLLADFGERIRDASWLHGKLFLVALLLAIHVLMWRWRRNFAGDTNGHSEKFFRIVNEMPTLLMIGIVILAVVKPF
ncbi:MAG: protoporphyrinogen oxidase HemJ [Rhodospirillales bacterium]|nr:protoporphyrinogen oxidase HemJ [Rhodospirillales bacterium]HJP54135.1 protoporphyrinogen oxidase HemJ [Rhodospirillales bacterium]